MKKIQLISSPVDNGKLPLYEDGVFAPLSLIWLASYLKFHGHEVEIIDGQHCSLDEIVKKITAPIVGISFNILSTDSLDVIARETKIKGSRVVVGGQAATPLARALLKNEDIDCVVRFDGEDALRGILEGKEEEQINNLVYRKDGQIIENPSSFLDLTKLPPVIWDIPGISLQHYWDTFAEVKKYIPAHRHFHNRPLSAFMQKGCPMRIGKGGCSFCSRVDRTLRCKSPQQAYAEFSYLASLGTDRIEEFSDSFLHNKKWLAELATIVKQKGHWGVPARVYADTRHIDNEVIDLMQVIGIDSVILGVESGNEEILRKNFKPNSIEQILKSVDLLGKAKMRCCPSFVLGLIGETEKTAEETFRIAEEINRRCEVEMAYFSVMTPFPGSRAWDMLLEIPEMYEKYGNTYKLDQPQLQRDFLSNFTQLGADGASFLVGKIESELKRITAQRDY